MSFINGVRALIKTQFFFRNFSLGYILVNDSQLVLRLIVLVSCVHLFRIVELAVGMHLQRKGLYQAEAVSDDMSDLDYFLLLVMHLYT